MREFGGQAVLIVLPKVHEVGIYEPRWSLAGGGGREVNPLTGDRAAFIC